MSQIIQPPVPPQSTISPEQRLEMFRQMHIELHEQVKYYQDSIAYHEKSLESDKVKLANAIEQLKVSESVIKGIEDTTELVAEPVQLEDKASSNGKAKSLEAVETQKSEADSQPKKESKAKAKAKTKTKTKGKAKSSQAVKTQKSKKNSPSKETTSVSSNLDDFESITAGVLAFVKSQEGVVDALQVANHFNPQNSRNLDKAGKKKFLSSIHAVFSSQMKKGILERTVPGKYLWKGN